ncbi:unnamed protein product [Prunus armeniaca]|uniref:Uncharacterized protein n=1 Tax=Prunus armeniaca TaxID=36596 RepID=A0A6J5W4J1_PRUAR|nr:unnamed protein product [Prunus armeniaca]
MTASSAQSATAPGVPLFTIHKNLNQSRNDVVEPPKPKPREVEKNIIVEASSKPLYDDEESLFSPTSHIIHIPEADDEDEDTIDPLPETTTSRSSRAMSFLATYTK